MTKILRLHYPTADTDEIGAITAAVRDQTLKEFESARISYSFSSQKNSGYLMVYPTDPILSIRVSDHETDSSEPEKKLIQENGNKTIINAEMENGQWAAENALRSALVEAEKKAAEIRQLLEVTKML